MCSINEDGDTLVVDILSKPTTSLEFCRRCLVNKSQALLRKTDPYCRECFMKYASHKFRSTLGKAKAVGVNEMVLLAYSGGLSSGAMVQLVCQGQEENRAQKKLVFKPSLLYIDG